MNEIEITPLSHPLAARITPPGSKSITNRVLLLAAMSEGRSQISHALFSDDTRFMIAALQRLGIKIEPDEQAGTLAVPGSDGAIPVQGADLFVGGAGTAMRFLTAFVTLGRGRFKIDGNERMRERPIGDLTDALRALGLKVEYELKDGYPPLVINAIGPDFGSDLGGFVTVNAERSSQFVSALLLAAPVWKKGLRLKVLNAVAGPFIEMTLKLMAQWGVNYSRDDEQITIAGNQHYRARSFEVEPDVSSASYFAAIAALSGGTVQLSGLTQDSVQGDSAVFGVLQRMGARVRWLSDGVEISGSGRLQGIEIDMSSMPDIVPTIAALAPFASSPTVIRNVAFIRLHESDRLAALATELRRIGVEVEEFDDGLRIKPSTLKPGLIQTYDDHRIAMSFSIVGTKVKGIRIANPRCVSKTYPNFFLDLAGI